MIGLIERIRAALPWAKPAPVDHDSLGAILGEALEAAKAERASRPHPLDLPLSDWPIDNAGGLALVCLAKQFCTEMATRGFDPVKAWDSLAALPSASLDDLRSAEGWSTLSALVSGGTVVLRLKADNPHQEITRVALQFAHSVAAQGVMTPGQVYDALIALPDSVLQLVHRRGSWPELERVVAGGGAPLGARTH